MNISELLFASPSFIFSIKLAVEDKEGFDNAIFILQSLLGTPPALTVLCIHLQPSCAEVCARSTRRSACWLTGTRLIFHREVKYQVIELVWEFPPWLISFGIGAAAGWTYRMCVCVCV